MSINFRALLVVLLLCGCGGGGGGFSIPTTGPTQSPSPTPTPTPGSGQFSNPQQVTIAGYSGDAMEPFISRDGKYLFFNNSNTATTTRLFWATEMDPLNFRFQGEIAGVNTAQLDAVASMDLSDHFYFITNRSYSENLSTVYTGTFVSGSVAAIGPVPGVSAPTLGLVDFDAEISADGNTLYFTEGQIVGGRAQSAQIIIAVRGAGGFSRLPQSSTIMAQINTPTLNYAADTSASQLELFFTRLDPDGPAIYMATRPDASAPFGAAVKITAITGFAEAPSISPDGRSLYYHLKSSGQFVIYRVTRP
jgi:Tol biopolymer transport system component